MRLLLRLFILIVLASLPRAWADVTPEDLLKTGKADEALQLLNLEVQAHPNNAVAYNMLCRVYYQLEFWDTSMRMAEKSVSLEPRNSLYHQWLGRAAGRKAENSNPFTAFGLARRVRSEFEHAVALDGSNLTARTDLLDCRTHPRTCEPLRLTRCPAVRIEVGYLTNRSDRDRLANPAFRDLVAESILIAVKRLYLLGENDQPTGTFTFEDILNSDHEFAPGLDKLTMDSPAPLKAGPDGRYPIPMPGIEKHREYPA